jgi:hypothetical protein
MKVRLAATLLLGLVLGFVLLMWDSRRGGYESVALAQSPADAPPDLKAGLRVDFWSGQAYSDEKGVKVTKLQGGWVYVEGKLYSQYTGKEIAKEGWVNFANVSWYRIIKE